MASIRCAASSGVKCEDLDPCGVIAALLSCCVLGTDEESREKKVMIWLCEIHSYLEVRYCLLLDIPKCLGCQGL